MTQENPESIWQDFFEENTWIFGYGLNYQFLKTVTGQPHYGGQSVLGKGSNKGDFLQATQAINKFTVLVEIKTPQTTLVDNKKYRNDVYSVGPDVLGGISQLRVNARRWETEGAKLDANKQLERGSIHTVQPKKILVAGNTKQLSEDESKLISFELFRKNQSDIEILTYDELYERAKFIVDHSNELEVTN